MSRNRQYRWSDGLRGRWGSKALVARQWMSIEFQVSRRGILIAVRLPGNQFAAYGWGNEVIYSNVERQFDEQVAKIHIASECWHRYVQARWRRTSRSRVCSSKYRASATRRCRA